MSRKTLTIISLIGLPVSILTHWVAWVNIPAPGTPIPPAGLPSSSFPLWLTLVLILIFALLLGWSLYLHYLAHIQSRRRMTEPVTVDATDTPGLLRTEAEYGWVRRGRGAQVFGMLIAVLLFPVLVLVLAQFIDHICRRIWYVETVEALVWIFGVDEWVAMAIALFLILILAYVLSRIVYWLIAYKRHAVSVARWTPLIGPLELMKAADPEMWQDIETLVALGARVPEPESCPIPPQCIACEYDLTGNVSGVCPECGQQLVSDDELRERLRRTLRAMIEENPKKWKKITDAKEKRRQEELRQEGKQRSTKRKKATESYLRSKIEHD